MRTDPPSAITSTSRCDTVDALRAMVVVIIVVGLTVDALLVVEARAGAWSAVSDRLGGVTAALLFMLGG